MNINVPPEPPEQDRKIINMHGCPLEIIKKDQKKAYCHSNHRRVSVDEQERLLECQECGKVIDAFDYVLGWSRDGERRMTRLKGLDDEIRLKFNELEAVKAALAREKARVRKVNQDAPEVVTWKRQMEVYKIKNNIKK